MPGSVLIFDECRTRHTVDALGAPVLSSTPPGHLPPMRVMRGQKIPAQRRNRTACAPRLAQQADRPSRSCPHTARSGLHPTSVPLNVSRGANRAGRRRREMGKHRIEHQNPIGFLRSIRPRLRLLSISAASARPWAHIWPGSNGTRRCLALNANDGGTTALMELRRRTTLHTTPFLPPPSSFAPESRNKRAPLDVWKRRTLRPIQPVSGLHVLWHLAACR